MFAITGAKPGFVTAYQQGNMMEFSSETPGRLVYSGGVGDVQAGSDGTVSR